MAKEYIEREALEVALNHRLNFLMAENGEYDHYTSGFDEAVTRVENFPVADVVPAAHGELTEHIRGLLRAEKDERVVVLPCRVGDRIYRVVDDCTFPGDCGTKRMCKGCEYRNLFIEQTRFRLYLLTDDGKLRRGYYRTREEAEKALED